MSRLARLSVDPRRTYIHSPAAPARAWLRRLNHAGASLTLACLVAGCDVQTGPYTRDMGDLSGADRIEVSIDGTTPVATIRDRQTVDAVADFVSHRRDNWINPLSGTGTERYFTFHAGGRRLARIGIGGSEGLADGGFLSDGDGFVRQLDAAEFRQLIALLDLPWPPPEEKPGQGR
jgi:hypothetical protein